MFGSFFGTCCNAPAVESELRVGDQNSNGQQQQQHQLEQRRKGASGASGAGSGSKTKSTQRLPKYRIDNSYLQIQGPPGVSYRYSKKLEDKVKTRQSGPARWGDIVEGIDEGDGWLKVGEYYLPMTYEGKPVITPVSGTGSTPPSKQESSSPSRTVGSSAPSTSAIAAPSAAAPSATAVGTGTSAGVSRQKETSVPATRSTQAEKLPTSPTPTSPGGAVPPVSAGPREVPPAARAPQKSIEKKEVALKMETGVEPRADKIAQDGPAKPNSEVLQAVQPAHTSPKAENAGWVADFSQDTIKAVAKDDVGLAKKTEKVSQQKRPWNKRPSVGTWLQIPVAEEAMEPAALTVSKKPHHHLPSVGTWLNRPVKVKCVK